MTKHHFTYLALGDSYTVGESVALHESFPYQTIQLLRKKGLHFHAPEIVAQTGWTSFELAEHLLHTSLNDTYDFVTLLIGVNNQYRRMNIDDYRNNFEFLLKKSLQYTSDKPERVIVLSIPDWTATPFFGNDNDSTEVSKEINAFNIANKQLSQQYNVHYIDITESSREAKNDSCLIAEDGLHPSAKEYEKWAYLIADYIQATIKS